jgi:SAM-dependent methyltransferase
MPSSLTILLSVVNSNQMMPNLLYSSEPLLKTAAASTVDETLDGPQYQLLPKAKRALSSRPAVVVADCIHVPLRDESCDAAICIAVMHHLSTEGRRTRCLAELRRIVKVGGLINVQAWALEQEDDSKRKFHGTDVLVPFNAQPKYLDNSSQHKNSEDNGTSGAINKGVAQMMAEKYNGAEFDSKKNLVVFQRYCHMYRKGELEDLCARVPGLEVLESSFERGNHVVSLRATQFDIKNC